MNREDILSKSREENKNGDEREQQALVKSRAIAKSVGGLLCFVIILLEELLSDRAAVAGMGAFCVYFSMEAVEFLRMGFLMKAKGKVAAGVLCAMVALAMLAGFIVALCKEL